jgi:hypothetical protein
MAQIIIDLFWNYVIPPNRILFLSRRLSGQHPGYFP